MINLQEIEGIKLRTPGSAVRLASVARHVTDCATRPGISIRWVFFFEYPEQMFKLMDKKNIHNFTLNNLFILTYVKGYFLHPFSLPWNWYTVQGHSVHGDVSLGF